MIHNHKQPIVITDHDTSLLMYSCTASSVMSYMYLSDFLLLLSLQFLVFLKVSQHFLSLFLCCFLILFNLGHWVVQ